MLHPFGKDGCAYLAAGAAGWAARTVKTVPEKVLGEGGCPHKNVPICVVPGYLFAIA